MSRAARLVFINGRFLGRPITGVERVATELLRALAQELTTRSDADTQLDHGYRLALPPGVTAPPEFDIFRPVTVGRAGGHLWEQVWLPLASRGALLVSLCNTAPLLKRRQAVFLHDAGVFRTPDAYTVAFRWWYRIMFLVLSRVATCLLTNSRFSQRELAECCRIDEQRLIVLPLGHEHALRASPDDSIFGRFGLDRTGFVLAVSSANPNKNFARAVEAMRGLAVEGDGPALVVAGRVNQRIFTSLEFPPGVKLVGAISDEELSALYEGAGCLLYPSVYEGFGLPPIEAMARRCPVVAGNSSSLPEICGDAAEYCDPLHVESITDAVRRVLWQPHRHEQLRAAGSGNVERYRWSMAGTQLHELIERNR